MRKIIYLLIIMFFLSLKLLALSSYVEFNQMLAFHYGLDYKINNLVGLRGSIGAAPLSIKTISYTTVLYYTVNEDFNNFVYSIEIGMPLAYVDLLEDEYVNWDSNIDSPFAGWLFGLTIRGEYYKHFFLKAGISYWVEWQEDDGFKNGIIPIFSLGCLI